MSIQIAFKHDLGAFKLDIDIECSDGITAIFGRSGAGKTSLINAVSGILTPTTGTICAQGRVLFDSGAKINIPKHKRNIGYVFQNARLFPHLNVRKNLTFAAPYAKTPPTKGRTDEIIDLLGLGGLLDRAPRTLSGGEEQRVALGRALLCTPDMLVMDEPLAALDDARKQEILPYLERLRSGALRVPILYVSHALDEVARLADDIVIMEEGRVKIQGPVLEILSNPAAVPLLGVRKSGAILIARVIRHESDGITILKTSGGHLELPGVMAPVGTNVRLRVMAQDVILSRTRPKGLSSRNILAAKVTNIHIGTGPGAAIAVKSGEDIILARITARAVRDMALEVGQDCYAIFKATTVAPDQIGR